MPLSRKNLNKYLHHQKLSCLPPFTPIVDYEVFFLHRSSNTNVLHHLIQLAQNTTFFSVDTEGDKYTNRPALIQLEFINETISTVVLVEVCQLPSDQKSLVFWLIRSLFIFIFQRTTTIYAWGDALKELAKFVDYNLYNVDTLQEPTMINLQSHFLHWHYAKNKFYATNLQLWGLQAAVADQFEQFLDKTETLNTWSRGLDRLHADRYKDKIQSMIQYAVNDCLAVTKLAIHMGEKV